MKERLYEIDLMRAVVVLLLVTVHCFTMYSGVNTSWPLPDNYNVYEPYIWIQRISYSSLLEGYTFISGYVLAFSLHKRKVQQLSQKDIIKKIYRLLVPSILFSILYSSLFYNKNYLSVHYVYDIISGLGHLWYLPMLFWCFTFEYALRLFHLKEPVLLILSVTLSIVSVIAPNYFQIGQALYFYFFFRIGAFVYDYMGRGIERANGWKLHLIASLLLTISMSLLILSLSIQHGEINQFVERIVKIAYALSGVISIFLFCFSMRNVIGNHRFVINLSYCSFGIYIFQEFIIKVIYYKTTAPSIFNQFALPWVTFIFTLVISYYLTYLLKKTKVGDLL